MYIYLCVVPLFQLDTIDILLLMQRQYNRVAQILENLLYQNAFQVSGKILDFWRRLPAGAILIRIKPISSWIELFRPGHT